MSEFQKAIESLINMYSQENGSHTPDYILAEYLTGCLETFNKAVRLRDHWWSFEPWQHEPLPAPGGMLDKMDLKDE